MVDEPVRLELSGAFQQIQELSRRITDAIASGGKDAAADLERQLAAVKASIPVELADPQELTALISGAVEAASGTTVDVAAGDTSAVTTGIDQAITAADTTVPVSADASTLTGSIDEAVGAADTTVDVEVGNLEQISASIADAVTAGGDAGEVIPASAAASADTLSESLGQVKDKATAAGGGLNTAGSAATIYSGIAAAASGSSGSLATSLSALGPAGAAGATGILATVGVLGKAVTEAANAEEADRRLTDALGASREAFESIDIGGLNTDLSSLALQLGSDDDAIRSSVANLAILGKSAGATQPEIAGTSKELVALAANAVALNPSLGSVQDVLDRLPLALARGGKAAAQYGIDITATDIANEAAAQGISKTVDELSIYERVALAADAATKKAGDSIGTNVTRGADLAVVKLRSFRQSLSEALEAQGTDLLGPVVELAQNAAPILIGVIEVIGRAGKAIVTVLTPIVESVGPSLVEIFEDAGHALDAVQPLLTVIAGLLGTILPVAVKIGEVYFKWLTPLGLAIQLLDKIDQYKEAIGNKFAGASESLDSVARKLGVEAFAQSGESFTKWSTIVTNSAKAAAFLGISVEEYGRQAKALGIPLTDTIAIEQAIIDRREASSLAAAQLTSDLEGYGTAQTDANAVLQRTIELLDVFDGGTSNASIISATLAAALDITAKAGIQLNAELLTNRGLADQAFVALLQLGNGATPVVQKLAEAIRNGSLSQAEFLQLSEDTGLSLDALGAIESKVRGEMEEFGKSVDSAIGGITQATQELSDKGKTNIEQFTTDLQTQAVSAAVYATAIEELIRRGATATAQHLLAAGQDATGAAETASQLSDAELATIEQTNRDVDTSLAASAEAIKKHASEVALGADNVKTALADAKPDGTALANDIDAALLTATAAIANSKDEAHDRAVEVGEQIPAGVVEGIRSGDSQISQAAAQTIDVAILAAQTAAQISSPSRLFATDVGFPLTEGIAKGILAGMFKVEDAIGEVIDGAQAHASQQLQLVFDAIEAGRGQTRATADLAASQQKLADLTVERSELPKRIISAKAQLEQAITDGAKVTARETQQIEQAAARLDQLREQFEFQTTTGPADLAQAQRQAALDAAEVARISAKVREAQANVTLGTGDRDTLKSLQDEQRDREQAAATSQRLVESLTSKLDGQRVTTADLAVAEEDLAEARRQSILPTDNLADAQQELADLYQRQKDIGPELQQAAEDITDAQLGVLEAYARAAEAGQKFYEDGGKGVGVLMDVGNAAGFAASQVSALVNAYAGRAQGAAASLGGGGPSTTPFNGSVDVFGNGTRFDTPEGALATLNFIRAKSGDSTFQSLSQAGQVLGHTFNIYQANDPNAVVFAINAKLGLAASR